MNDSNVCTYTYYIFLYDTIYSIGKVNEPEEWNSIETGSVKPYNCPIGSGADSDRNGFADTCIEQPQNSNGN